MRLKKTKKNLLMLLLAYLYPSYLVLKSTGKTTNLFFDHIVYSVISISFTPEAVSSCFLRSSAIISITACI